MRDSFGVRVVIAAWAVACLAFHLGSVHRWFATPFPIWAGWDEAYITVFAQRMLDGRWLPYVDAVSHRGPVLYWLGAVTQWLAGGHSWAAMRHAALLVAEANLVLAFLLGVAFRRPLAGFLAGAAFVFSTAYAMEPKDGIGFNGEIVAMPFVLLGALLTTMALRDQDPRPDSRLWSAAASGLLVTLGGLCKQPAFLHLLPLGLWWLATAIHRRDNDKPDWRPLIAFAVGAATPALAVAAFFARAGAWRPFSYYLFTYNSDVYMEPVTVGYAIESSFLFWREHGALLLLTMLGATWAFARFAAKLDGLGAKAWSNAYLRTALPTTTALHMLLALAGALGTFRFWDHYFITALPWIGLLLGTLLEERLLAASPAGTARAVRASLVVLACFVGLSFVLRHLTTLWLDGQRRAGEFYGNPDEEPIANYIRTHSSADQSVFVWGFAPELYTASRRRSASRFVFTTFPSGLVPWFHWLPFEHEERLAVPGSRDLLLRELEAEKPPLILDVPNSIHGRSIRRYPQLSAYVDQHYCFRETVFGRNGRIADIYHRRGEGEDCTRQPPPIPKPR
jgi:4-amino-4-deoxy-L-arabinose transferase-like glycosyltransferase